MALSLTNGSYLAEISIPAQVRNHYKDHGGRRALYRAAVASEIPGLAPPPVMTLSPSNAEQHPNSIRVGYPGPTARKYPVVPGVQPMHSTIMGHKKTHPQPFGGAPYARGDTGPIVPQPTTRRNRYNREPVRKQHVSGMKHVQPPPRRELHPSGLTRINKSPFTDPLQLQTDGHTARPSRVKTFPEPSKYERRGGRKSFGVPSEQVYSLLIRPESAPARFVAEANANVPTIRGFTTLGDAGKKHRFYGGNQIGDYPFARSTPRSGRWHEKKSTRRVQYGHPVHKEMPSSIRHVEQSPSVQAHPIGRGRAGNAIFSDPFQLQAGYGSEARGRKHFNHPSEFVGSCMVHNKVATTPVLG